MQVFKKTEKKIRTKILDMHILVPQKLSNKIRKKKIGQQNLGGEKAFH